MWSMDQIKRRNQEIGHHFFEPGAMRFFDSRVGSTVYEGPGGIYFVTSEQFHGTNDSSAPRRYTVREFDPATGRVNTIGAFAQTPKSTARRAAAKLAAQSEPAA